MPARYREVRRALIALGLEIEERSAKGSHVVVNDKEGHTRIRSRDTGGDHTELSDAYLRALCRAFELDWQSFRKQL